MPKNRHETASREGTGHGDGDTTAPTTILVDGGGTVRCVFRPDSVMTRLSPAEVLAAIDKEMPAV